MKHATWAHHKNLFVDATMIKGAGQVWSLLSSVTFFQLWKLPLSLDLLHIQHAITADVFAQLSPNCFGGSEAGGNYSQVEQRSNQIW